MSIPLDRLYHYIESIAQEIRGDRVIIYRFYPHGSKNVKNLNHLCTYKFVEDMISPHIYCNDQEPLNFQLYQDVQGRPGTPHSLSEIIFQNSADLPNYNLRGNIVNIYDNAILLHSERRSLEVEWYQNLNFTPVYYWSHAVIASDWFRYAEHITQNKNIKKRFLIYNRAWSGTREYRLAFADHLIQLEITGSCLMNCSPVDSTLDKHYALHHFANPAWRPTNIIENYFPIGTANSHYSADFDIKDYESTAIEVVLETLFDDSRLHLTEKILRPIAVGQPFILASTHGSLEYLRSYGFKTFSECWDESYDLEIDPEKRLVKITELMMEINCWDESRYKKAILQAQSIANYNKQYFFSNKFQQLIEGELVNNLTHALAELENTNTGLAWVEQNKKLFRNPALESVLYTPTNLQKIWLDQIDYAVKKYNKTK